MRNNKKKSVAIVGGGMIGLSLAHALAQAGIAVELIEKQEPPLVFTAGLGLRVSALNLHSHYFLRGLGIWDLLRSSSVAPFIKIEAWAGATRQVVHFDARDIGKKYLGYIVENRELVRVLWEQAALHPLITLTLDSHLDNAAPHELLVGADGAESMVRNKAGIALKERAYGQSAIVACVHSTQPHQQTAYQHFLKTGPLGVLPWHEAHLESIVWSADEEYAQTLMQMSDMQFNIALSNALDLRLGKLTLAGERQLFPLIMRHAQHYVKPGIALVGDAAHTVHPLAGQGANLGLQDVQLLASELIAAHQTGQSLGSLRLLRRYERKRQFHNSQMLAVMQIFRGQGDQLGWAFAAVDASFWLRQQIMHIAV